MAVYTLYVSRIFSEFKYLELRSVDEIYSLSSLILSIFFGCYSAYIMSHWWALRVHTGSVSAAVVDIALILHGYISHIDYSSIPKSELAEIFSNLKRAHAYHIAELFRSSDPTACVNDLLPSSHSHSGLIPLLAVLLSQITTLCSKLPLSDPIKFSLLPAIQSNLSSIRSHAGDCTMIQNCKYPKIFSRMMYLFLILHLGYLPIHLCSKSMDPVTIYTGSLLGFTLITSCSVIPETHFTNPFAYNSFRLDRIIESTFETIDGLGLVRKVVEQ